MYGFMLKCIEGLFSLTQSTPGPVTIISNLLCKTNGLSV